MGAHIIHLIDNEFVTISLEFVTDAEPYVHLKYNKPPTKSTYKWTKEFANNLAIELGVYGLTHLFAVYEKDDSLGIKFSKNMGFEEVNTFGEDKVLMALEI